MRVAIAGSLALLALPSLALPSRAQAQMPDDRARLGAHFAFAVAGDANISVGNIDTAASLDPTVGGALRVEVPLHDYFVLGGFFEILAFEWDGLGAEREPVFNLDLVAKGRYVAEASGPLGADVDLQVNTNQLAVQLGGFVRL